MSADASIDLLFHFTDSAKYCVALNRSFQFLQLVMQSVIKFYASSYGDRISSADNATGSHFSLIIPTSFHAGHWCAITFTYAIQWLRRYNRALPVEYGDAFFASLNLTCSLSFSFGILVIFIAALLADVFFYRS